MGWFGRKSNQISPGEAPHPTRTEAWSPNVLKEIQGERGELLCKLFNGKKLTRRGASDPFEEEKNKIREGIRQEARKRQGNPQGASESRRDLLDDWQSGLTIDQEVINSMGEVVALSIPYIGQFVQIGLTVKSWMEVIKRQLDTAYLGKIVGDVCSGEAKEAVAALRNILEHEKEFSLKIASLETISLGAKALCPEAAGPGLSIAKSVAKAAIKVHHYDMLAKMSRAGQEKIDKGEFDITLFQVCPLLGCYMLRCAETSDLIPVHYADNPNWMDVVDGWTKEVRDRLRKQADEVIKNSPFVMPDAPKTAPQGGERLIGIREAVLRALRSNRVAPAQ